MSKLLGRHRQRLAGVPQPSQFRARGSGDDDRPPLTTEQRREAGLLDARVALPATATVTDQRTGRSLAYDPDAICPRLHNDTLWYYGEGPRDDNGMNKWMLTLGPRQSGKSLVSSLCVDNICAQLEGQTGLIIADTEERAKTLFRYISLSHRNRPRRLTPVTVPVRESNQITYDHPGGTSAIRCLGGQTGLKTGIGRAPDVTQISEVPFIPGFADFWFGFFPSMVNRANSFLTLESTPAPMTEPSAEAFKNLVAEARKGYGRWLFSFTAFYESTLNERRWDKSWTLDDEEHRLLRMFGPGGRHPNIGGKYANDFIDSPGDPRYLTLQNLAFRRMTIREVEVIRRWPDLFFVFYPTDSVSCWAIKGGGVIPSDVLAKHQGRVVIPWLPHETYKVYRKPQPGAKYVIAVDPAGYGHDHAAFQVLEVWRDRIYQAAVFACPNITPNKFTNKVVEVAKEYNQALIGVERNGVGLAVLALLERELDRGEIRNLYYDRRGVRAKPGWHASKTSIEESLGALIDELRERLWLFDAETVDQLADYRNDKVIKLSDRRELLAPGDAGKGRRTKGHYDRASALALGCLLVQEVAAAKRPAYVSEESDQPEEVAKAHGGPLTWEEREEIRKKKKKRDEYRKRLLRISKKKRGRRKPKTRRVRGGR